MTSLLDQALGQPGRIPSPSVQSVPGSGFKIRTKIALQLKGDDSLWHERIVLGRLDREHYVCLTPDLEIVNEWLTFNNRDIRGMRICRGDGTYLGVDPAEFFSFTAAGAELSEEDISEWVREAEMLIATMAVVDVPQKAEGPLTAGSGAGVGGGLVADALRAARNEDKEVWLAAETIGSTVVGSIVKTDGNTTIVPGSDRAIHQLAGGAYIFLRRRVIKEELPRDGPLSTSDQHRDEHAVLPEGRIDARILNLSFDVRGARHIEYYSGIQLCVPTVLQIGLRLALSLCSGSRSTCIAMAALRRLSTSVGLRRCALTMGPQASQNTSAFARCLSSRSSMTSSTWARSPRSN